MQIDLSPSAWQPFADRDQKEHAEQCRENARTARITVYRTDDGWTGTVVVPTSGACSRIESHFMLPAGVSDALDELYELAEDWVLDVAPSMACITSSLVPGSGVDGEIHTERSDS